GSSIGVVAAALDTRTSGVPLIVYNPSGFDRHDQVRIVHWQDIPAEGWRVVGPDGDAVPIEITPMSRSRGCAISFLSSVPANGFTVYRIEPGLVVNPESELSIGENFLENACYRIELDADGNIARLFDKRLQR